MYPSNINRNNYAYSCSTRGDIDQPPPLPPPPPPPPSSCGNNRGFLYYNIGGDDLNPDTELDEESPLSSFSGFLTQYSPYVHLEDDAILRQHLHDLILHQQQQQPPPPPSPPPPIDHDQTVHNLVVADDDDYTEKNSCYTTAPVQEQYFPPRKRSSKKDRHSKIDTAHGPRDRRMRLSLDVARSFFGLQDILGFDKASKTVEWLLNKSKTAIKELKRGLSHDQIKKHSCSFISASSTSESCEVLSGADECAARINDENRSLNSNSCSPGRHEEEEDDEDEEDKKKTKKKSKKKEAVGRGLLRRTTPHHPLSKETRERARARARERTIQKRNIINGPPELWNSFEDQIMGQYDHQTHDEPGSSSIQLKNGGMSSIVGDSSLVTGNWSLAPIFFNYQQNAGPSQEYHQFTDFQCYGKPWEGINN